MVKQTKNEHKIKRAVSMCDCLIELISGFKCSLVKNDGGRYNKPSLISNSSNKKLARTSKKTSKLQDSRHGSKFLTKLKTVKRQIEQQLRADTGI